jgi:hypothetical protein
MDSCVGELPTDGKSTGEEQETEVDEDDDEEEDDDNADQAEDEQAVEQTPDEDPNDDRMSGDGFGAYLDIYGYRISGADLERFVEFFERYRPIVPALQLTLSEQRIADISRCEILPCLSCTGVLSPV